jgi:protein-serine/threonine kinase
MDKLRSVVNSDDPKTLYNKIKKIGQGYVIRRLCPLDMFLTFFSHTHSASGHVYVAKTLATGKKVAIKEMDLSRQPRIELIVNEILVMKESQHPNIVNFLDSYLVKNNELWVVMEYMEGGALTDIIENNPLEERMISRISLEVSLGVMCHRRYADCSVTFFRHARVWAICTNNTSSTVISSQTTFFSMLRAALKSVRVSREC